MNQTRASAGFRFGQSFEAAERARNNLTLLRFLAAFAVLFAHCWPIAFGYERADPITQQLRAWFGPGVVLSSFAVWGFFVISGYLVTKSALSRGLGDYAIARALRIFPALIVNVLLCAFVLGLAVTTLPVAAYLADEQTWKFVGNNVLSWNVIYRLPGVFEANPLQAVNGSLWTLPLEIRCYIAIGLFLATGILRRGWLFTLVAAALIAGDALYGILGADGAACFVSFLFGALVYVHRKYAPASVLPALALIGAALLAPTEIAAQLIGLAGFAWLVLWLGLAAPRMPWFDDALGDPSYGIYIYAFPIQQLVVLLVGAGAPWLLFAISAPATFVAGLLSWKLLEAPILARKSAASRALAKLFSSRRSAPALAQPSRIEP